MLPTKGSLFWRVFHLLKALLILNHSFFATPSIGASSSQLILEEKEEGREEEKEDSEEIVDVSNSDKFKVFKEPLSPESISDEMGIQRKFQRSLMELIEDQPGRGVPGKPTQPKLPPSPPKSPFPPPLPSLPSRPEPADPKRKIEQKGKDVVGTGRSRPTREDETQ